MILTNHQNLPEPLVRAITWSDRDREGCDYTITELLRPPRIAQLEREHADEITEDASDRIWMLLGSAGHEVLRRSAAQGLLFSEDWTKERERNVIVEERAIVEVIVGGIKYKVGGQIDYSESDKCIWDYKFTSVYAAKEGTKPEWDQQLNCYRWMAAQYGIEIHHMQIVCIYRDWSKSKASREPDYPQSGVRTFGIPKWPEFQAQHFICDRIKLHESAKTTLPECTSEETWEKPEVWAVKKKGNKRALKLFDSAKDATDWAASDPKLIVENRPGERPRCESYCRCAPFCDQWKQFKEQNP